MILYKYLNPDRIDVLEKCMARYSQPEVFNDPFELKPNICSFFKSLYCGITNDDFKSHLRKIIQSKYPEKIEDQDFQQMIDKVIKDNQKFFTRIFDNVEELTPELTQIVYQIVNTKFGIFSLSKTCKSLLMWAHYAKYHEGFIIGFNSDHSCFHGSPIEGNLREVIYQADRPSLDFMETTEREMLMIKSKDWKYEKEWRITRELKDANYLNSKCTPPAYLFKIPPDAVQCIIFGCRIREKTRLKLLKIITGSPHFGHVKIS